MSNPIRRIAISTGGGDAPGLNAVIRAVVIAASNRGWETYGIREGFNGILFPERFPDGGVFRLTRDRVRGIGHLGGTILGTTNKGNPLHFPMKMPDGTVKDVDRTDEILECFARKELDALISIGGDGSLTIAHALFQKGLRVVGVPKTIDNDLDKTATTFGFDTAVAFATECLDRLHSTAESHQRIMVVEVMGRYAGWIALHAGLAGGADVILIPEIPYDVEKVAERVRARDEFGAKFTIVVVAEGAKPKGGQRSIVKAAAGEYVERLGGVGHKLAHDLEALTGKEARTVVLGHLQRGGSPTSYDRVLATRFGARAVDLIMRGQFGKMVASHPPDIVPVSLSEVVGKTKTVPEHHDILLTARSVGISFGD
jgi:6-phosphofructokinase 1